MTRPLIVSYHHPSYKRWCIIEEVHLGLEAGYLAFEGGDMGSTIWAAAAMGPIFQGLIHVW